MSNLADELNGIADALRAEMNAKNEVRDRAVSRSRELIRHCSESIRAAHRREWDSVDAKLALIRDFAAEMTDALREHPELYHAGYTQDALKEVVEAHTLAAMIRQHPLPDAAALGVSAATYLNGLAEAATELRRFILDIMRQEVSHSAEAERLLGCMDAIYDQLVTFDFPDAITNGLRRQTDVVRGVLEKTRGDLTTSFRQQMLQEALKRAESRG